MNVLKIRSELLFVRDIASRALEAHDLIVDGLTKAQQGARLLRRMKEQRERIATLGECASDGLAALQEQNP